MYEFFMNFVNCSSCLVDMGNRQSDELDIPAIDSVVNKRKSIATDEDIDPELGILEKEFGDLSEGKQIVVELRRLLLLLPRERKKADAYKGLRSKLKKMGVELIITSKMKGSQNGC